MELVQHQDILLSSVKCNVLNVMLSETPLKKSNQFIIQYQQMHSDISYKVRILCGTILHVSAPWCHPQGALRSLLKLHTIVIVTKCDG